MLDSLRRGANTWVAKFFFVILIASFGVWGVSGIVTTGTSVWVAEVGDTTVEAADFQRLYARQVQSLSRQFGQPIDADMASQFGVPQQVLGQMIADAALTDAATSSGLGIGDATLAKEIADDPSLRAPGAASFDRSYLTSLLRDNGLTESAYVEERRRLNLRSQLTEGLTGGMATPAALVEAYHRFQNDIRTIAYVRLDSKLVEPVPAPTDSELATWFDANKDEYQAPELRTISYLVASPETVADPASVSDDNARKEYERTRQTYVAPEKRRIDQLLLPNHAEAEAAAAKIKAGATFDQVVAERGLKPEDVALGLIAKSEVIDPAVADAAFGMTAPGISAPIDARFGGALVRVTEVVPEAIKPFEAVAADIKSAIAKRTAESAVLDTHDEVEDARAGGATLAEIAERFRLALKTVEIDSSGNGTDGQPVDLSAGEELVTAAFASEEGVDNDPVQIASHGFVWFSVDKVTPARDLPLTEVRDQAVAAWTVEKSQTLLAAKADEMATAVRSGGDLAALAAAAGATVATADNITRNGDVPALGSEAVGAAYDGPEGHVAAVAGPDGSRVVLKVTRSVVPAFFPEAADAVDASRRFRPELASGLLALYTEEMKTSLGVRVNDQVLQSVIGTSRQ